MKYKKILWLSLFIALMCLGAYINEMLQALSYADAALDGDIEGVVQHTEKAVRYRNSGFLIALIGTGLFFYSNRS